MNNAGFTPGPWEHDGTKLMSGGVCVVDLYGTMGGNAGADARLIAAAPSLYADAEFLCARIRELEGEMTDDDGLSRQYFGHVLPAVARMESCLTEARDEQVVA